MEKILIVSFLVFAIHYTMQEGEIFGWIGKLLSKLPHFLHNPLFSCPVCMTFWYGYPLYWFIWGTSWQDWLVTVIAAMGLNAIILKLAPDKETPSIHLELGEIAERITDMTQWLKDNLRERQPGPKFHPKQNQKK